MKADHASRTTMSVISELLIITVPKRSKLPEDSEQYELSLKGYTCSSCFDKKRDSPEIESTFAQPSTAWNKSYKQ